MKKLQKKLSKYLSITVVPFLIYVVMRLLWFTYRKDYTVIGNLPSSKAIAVSWHGELFISPQVYRKFYPNGSTYAIISQHLDGEIIAKVLSKFNILPIRGSSSKRAVGVLIEALKISKANNSILISPDGPRGPRHSMSDGAIILAQKNNLPLFCVNFRVENDKFWQLKSWDKFVIPKPFAKLKIMTQTIELKNLQLEDAKELLKTKMTQFSLQ